jgi:hypothetical protein
MGRGNLTEKEYRELLGLEYVLTWGYSEDETSDDKRFRKLNEKKDYKILNIGKICLSL